MQYREIEYKNEEEWHRIRRSYIGGSDCATIMGENPFKDNNILNLWKIKTGRQEEKDLSNNPAVIRGKESEEHLRELFQKKYHNYKVSVLEKTLVSTKYPFMAANLDGVIEDIKGKKGVLEIKTTTCYSPDKYYDVWIQKDEKGYYTVNDIPIYYWLQIQHYLAVTGWEYAILFADITLDWQKGRSILQVYECLRNEEAIKEIVKKELEFNSYVIDDIEPHYIKKYGG